ncbi:MAG: SurA N-terminal domain-containing protein [Pseudomonadota bacterium]
MGNMSISKIFVWGLLGLLIFALMGFGVTSFSGSGQQVATVGQQTVTANDYFRAFQRELQVASAEARRGVTVEEFRSRGGDQLVLNRLVTQAAITDAATRQGVSVSDERIGEEILAQPAFQGANGGFDRTQYQFVLNQQGLSVSDFEEQVRNDLAGQILQTAVVAGVPAQEGLADLIYDFVSEERSITFAALDDTVLEAPIGVPTQTQLADFLADNEDMFVVPETRVIAYAWLSPEMVLDEVAPDEATLRAIYDERIAEYVQPERRLVERLVFPDTSAAQAAKDRFDAGTATFDALVAERNLSLNDVDLGDVAIGELGTAGEPVFALEGPGVVGPLDSALGPALFRINAILSATEIPFEDAQEVLSRELALDSARRLIDDQIADVDDLLASGATLEELESEIGMEFARIDFRPDASDPIAGYDTFRRAASTVSADDFPEVITLEDGGIFALRLEEILPPTVPPLSEIEADVAASWTATQTANAIADVAQAVRDALAGGASFADQNLVAVEAPDLRRDGFVEDAPAGLLSEVFEMQQGDVAIVNDGASVAIVRLDAIAQGGDDGGVGDNIRALIADDASQSMARDLLDAFMQAEMATASVSINQQAVNGILTQIQAPTSGGF